MTGAFRRSTVDEYKILAKNGEDIICPSGYTMTKQSDGIFRCEGGGHQYRIEEGEIILDKLGNYWVRNTSEDEVNE